MIGKANKKLFLLIPKRSYKMFQELNILDVSTF